MSKRPWLQACAFGVIFFLMFSLGAAYTGPSSKLPYSKVEQLIKKECVSCHNATRHPEEVDFSSYSALMKSGEHGPIVVPGHPEQSKLISYVDGTKQPRMPIRRAPLTASQITLLKKWIAAGASK